jgi:hypothetical protein
MKPYKQEIADYINNVLDKKRPEFSNMAVCPFAAPELANNKLMIGMIGEDDKDLRELVEQFAASDYESAIIALPGELSPDDTKPFQIFVNKLLKSLGLTEYKNICFNPNDEVNIDGFNPRSHAPYFLINIAHRKVLNKAHKSLRRTEYYDKLNKAYREFLKINEKDKKSKYEQKKEATQGSPEKA